MVRQIGPSNAKWQVRAAGDYTMTSQRKSELDAVIKRINKNDVRIVDLSLSWTQCGDWGAEALADVIKVNTVLTSLDLYHNDIGPRGSGALARALRKNRSINTINLGMNNIGDEGAEEFMETVRRHNTSLTSLKLENNHVNHIKLRDLNYLLERNAAKKVDMDWHHLQNELLPLQYNHGELYTAKNKLEGLKETNDPLVIKQKEALQEEMDNIQDQIAVLRKKEDKLLEDGTWLNRNLDKFRSTVILNQNVRKACRLMRKKKDKSGPTLEEERTEVALKLAELQGAFMQPEANKWSAKKRAEMEDQVKELQLQQTRLRSLERAKQASLELERFQNGVEEYKERLSTGATGVVRDTASAPPPPDDSLDRYAPKTKGKGRFSVPEEEKMPLTHKYTQFDRTLREAGVSIPKDEITYRPVAHNRDQGRRFQEAFIDPGRRTVLGVRLRDRNPKNLFHKHNKYGADLVY
mmetsp:Transcript_12481/g.29906  ORF Transcript_12481/g.29906 Transcript_12481/m.29906 type:complete len:465 (+) Transcript_12481:110-1504(+)